MRLHRFRITVGQFLFIVAVAAANRGVFRLISERDKNSYGDKLFLIPPFGLNVGFLPLLNIALIGIGFFVVQRLRSLRCGSEGNPGSAPAAGTYFSLHFLTLGCLLALFRPEAIDRYLDMFLILTEYAAIPWPAIFDSLESFFSELVLECLILSGVISGPLLLLTGIGQMLARHCAATLPLRRFRALTCLVSFDFAGVALTIALTPRPFTNDQEVVIDFQVVDRESGQPIAASFIRMSDAFLPEPYFIPQRALTDAYGRARLTSEFEASGQRNAFQTMGVFSPWGRWLVVSAGGYQTLRIPLPEVLGPHVDLGHPGLATIALIRGKTPEDPLRDIAGIYSVQLGMGGSAFVIEPDGRFAWSASGCRSHDQEYGRLKIHDGEIELVPIPHPGKEIHPLMTWKYRGTAWGDRIYFSGSDYRELRELCVRALMPDRREGHYSSWIFSRRSDGDKPQVGLPRLPLAVWVRFFLDETSLRNEDGGVRRALESLFARTPQ